MSIATSSIGSRRSTAWRRCSSAARRGRRCASGCSRRSSPPSRSPRPMSRPRFAPRMSSFPPGGSNRVRRTSRCASSGRSPPPPSFGNLVVGRGADGYLVRLGDVARVEQGPENPYSSFRLNGTPAVGLGIVRQSGANTLAVADAAKALGRRHAPDLPEGMTLDVGSDNSLFIDRSDQEGLRTRWPRPRCWWCWSSSCSSAAGARR